MEPMTRQDHANRMSDILRSSGSVEFTTGLDGVSYYDPAYGRFVGAYILSDTDVLAFGIHEGLIGCLEKVA